MQWVWSWYCRGVAALRSWLADLLSPAAFYLSRRNALRRRLDELKREQEQYNQLEAELDSEPSVSGDEEEEEEEDEEEEDNKVDQNELQFYSRLESELNSPPLSDEDNDEQEDGQIEEGEQEKGEEKVVEENKEE